MPTPNQSDSTNTQGAEHAALAGRVQALRQRLEAALSPEHQRLVFELENALDLLRGAEHDAAFDRMVDTVADHLPGLAGVLRLLIAHASHPDMVSSCCEREGVR